MLSRSLTWDTKEFHTFLLERALRAFAWGRNCCATFAADGVLAMTGTDIMADLRGYTNPDEAFRKIKAVTGGTSLEAAVEYCTKQYGLTERQHTLLAQRGDLVLYSDGSSLIAGLVHLNGRDVVSPGEKGLLRNPLTCIKRVWTY